MEAFAAFVIKRIPTEFLRAPKPEGTETLLRLDKDTFESSIFKGNWKRAKEFIENDRNVLTRPISVHSRTALHVAACEGDWKLMEELTDLMRPADLGLADALGCTALHYAAVGGSVKACKALVKKNPSLTQTTSSNGWTPLLSAVYCATKNKDVVCFLSSVTTDERPGNPFTGPLAGLLAYAFARGGFHDILLYLIKRYPALATIKDERGSSILDALVLRPQDFQSGSNLGYWQTLIYPFVPVKLDYTFDTAHFPISAADYQAVIWPKRFLWNSIELLAPGIKQVYDAKLRHKFALELVKLVVVAFSPLSDTEIYAFFLESNIISDAASSGVVEIVQICLEMVPDIIWLSTDRQTLLKIAVQHRQEKILSLIHTMVVYNKFTSPKRIDELDNSILHLAAELADHSYLSVFSGAALQMQREVQWFRVVEKLVHPFLKDMPNSEGKTAQVIFKEQHRELLRMAEDWMQNTSNSCMVVTALIATVMLAALFTVPGGNNQNNGIPIFLGEKLFMVFAVSDALSFIFSSTSLLTFLSIHSARYTEKDFLLSLPRILIMGFSSLFLAIVFMMIAFAATFSLALRERSKFVAIAIPSLASLPVTIYALLQLPLFVQMYHSTYGSGIFQLAKI